MRNIYSLKDQGLEAEPEQEVKHGLRAVSVESRVLSRVICTLILNKRLTGMTFSQNGLEIRVKNLTKLPKIEWRGEANTKTRQSMSSWITYHMRIFSTVR